MNAMIQMMTYSAKPSNPVAFMADWLFLKASLWNSGSGVWLKGKAVDAIVLVLQCKLSVLVLWLKISQGSTVSSSIRLKILGEC